DWETPVAEVDLRVGGEVRIVMRDPETGAEYGARGEYRVVEPPRVLVFTWIWDHEPGRTQLIELEFTEDERGTTGLMGNSAIPSDELRASQKRGWNLCYDNLERALTRP